jgi:hypothetical protein
MTVDITILIKHELLCKETFGKSMQSAEDRIVQEAGKDITERKVLLLKQLQWFANRSATDLFRLLADCPVEIRPLAAREVLLQQGACVEHVCVLVINSCL